MSELNSTINFLEGTDYIIDPPKDEYDGYIEDEIPSEVSTRVFNIQDFGQELYKKSETRNRIRAERPNQNITGYDIAHNCIQQVLYKLRNTPIQNYADSWLPIFMRTEIGSAVHNFIQGNTKQFTEVEVNLKVPSLRFYGKIDYLIGSDVLGEIKTCTYEDYMGVIRKKQPREKDFLQAFTYQYVLSKYLPEVKTAEVKKSYGEKPKLDTYNIKKIQFLYISHDLISSQVETYTEMMERIRTLKQNLDSKKNPFFFITSVVVDLDDELVHKFHEFIEGKFDDIHHYLKMETNPAEGARYINTKNCFFCPYKTICKHSKWS